MRQDLGRGLTTKNLLGEAPYLFDMCRMLPRGSVEEPGPRASSQLRQGVVCLSKLMHLSPRQ